MRHRYSYAGWAVVSEVDLIGLPSRSVPDEPRAPHISVTCAVLPHASKDFMVDIQSHPALFFET